MTTIYIEEITDDDPGPPATHNGEEVEQLVDLARPAGRPFGLRQSCLEELQQRRAQSAEWVLVAKERLHQRAVGGL